MSTVISLHAYFGAGAKDSKDPSLDQCFSKSEIRALDDIIFPHYERGLITNWQYGKGRENSYLSAIDHQIGDRNQIFCVTKELRKNDFTIYRLDIPRLKIIMETVNFDKLLRMLKPSLPDVPAVMDPALMQQCYSLFKS